MAAAGGHEARRAAALSLLKRMPLWDVSDDVAKLSAAVPDLEDDLLDDVARPPRVVEDKAKDKKFIGCNYNQELDSYR